MYQTIDIAQLFPEAEQFIINNDRMLYAPFFKIAEEFCQETGAIIGGKVGIDLLMGKPLHRDSFQWDLYVDNAYIGARNLADSLSRAVSPHIPARTTAMKTNIKNKELTISVNTRVLFKIYSMERHRGIKLSSLMDKSHAVGYFTGARVRCLGEELQLIGIYHSLYSPANPGQWPGLLESERVLYNNLGSIGKGITGGGQQPQELVKINKRILGKSDAILIGDYALATMELESNPMRYQFISDEGVDAMVQRYKSTLEITSKWKRVFAQKYELNILSDFRLTKHTIYMANDKEQVPIADLYNSTEFELIPWKNIGGTRVASPWVLIRFQFIDLWVLKQIMHLQGKTAQVENRVRSYMNRVTALRDMIYNILEDDPVQLFQLGDYAGVYLDESVAKKKFILEIGDRFPIYYPAKNNDS